MEQPMTRVRLTTAAFALTLAVSSTALLAQTHPNFTGDWVLDKDKTAAAAGPRTGSTGATGATGGGSAVMAGGGGGGAMMMGPGAATTPEYKVTLTATTLTVDRVGVSTPQTYVYKLDGTESVNTVGPTTSKTKSHWDGAKLVTEGTRSVTTSQGDVSSSFKEVRSLEKDGAMLVEQTRQAPGQDPTTSYQVFVKK
jgi:hypothetical protein